VKHFSSKCGEIHQITGRHILYDSILHCQDCKYIMSHVSIVRMSARDVTDG